MTTPTPPPPAFPYDRIDEDPGMDLRTYIATQAMQGFCANPESAQDSTWAIAGMAVRQADDLLARLKG